MLPRCTYRYYTVRPPCQRVSTQEGRKENTRVTGNEHRIMGKEIIRFMYYAGQNNNNQFSRLFESLPSTRGNDILRV